MMVVGSLPAQAAAVEEKLSDTMLSADGSPVLHPLLNIKADEQIPIEGFNRSIVILMNEPVCPPGYQFVRLYKMEKFRSQEAAFTKQIAPGLVGKSKDEILNLIGKPLVKSTPEPYGVKVYGADEYWAYFFGFNCVRVILAISSGKCLAASVETDYKTMLSDQSTWKESVLSFVIGRSKAEIQAKYGGCEADKAYKSQLALASWVIPSMRDGTFAFEFDDHGKCISINDFHLFH